MVELRASNRKNELSQVDGKPLELFPLLLALHSLQGHHESALIGVNAG